ncbi:helix-turn-helix domain-containing protein [Qipengyuania nanhaisediminis]|uniref:helix-turn-helix domain-containing protein n=1 Tax=Qipengyuania nanhaisediminis TaxID=604088 RepID=UPI0038B3E370
MASSPALRAHLDPPSQIEGRNQPRRALRLETRGSLTSGEDANVTVHNISAAGLLIETQASLETGERLAIDMPEFGPVGAEIVWQSGQLYGCAFEQALGEAALAAAELRGDPRDTPIADHGPARFERERGDDAAAGDLLGVTINRLRRERGMTLAQVADLLGVSKPTVWAWEKGKARPLPERYAAIARVLGVEESALKPAGPDSEQARVVDDCRRRVAATFATNPRNVRIIIEL